MSWATTADVLSMLAKTVSASTVAMASEQITVFANRTEEASATMGNRDLTWLRKATVWQAVFLAENPGIETRQIVATHQQGGVRVDHAGASFVPREYPVVLAPMAARALRNLSWKGSRTIRIPNVATPLGSNIDFTIETSDDRSEWHPL